MSKNKRNSRKSHVPAGAGIRPVKSLGQNFLIDEEVIGRIVEGSGISKDTLVIEIGPGTGALTLPLAEAAGHVTAIELDERVIPGLRVKTFIPVKRRAVHTSDGVERHVYIAWQFQ